MFFNKINHKYNNNSEYSEHELELYSVTDYSNKFLCLLKFKIHHDDIENNIKRIENVIDFIGNGSSNYKTNKNGTLYSSNYIDLVFDDLKLYINKNNNTLVIEYKNVSYLKMEFYTNDMDVFLQLFEKMIVTLKYMELSIQN